MVFQMLALMKLPNAVLVPNRAFRTPLRPVVSLAELAANGFQPPRSLLSNPEGLARVCSVLGVAVTSWDRVFWLVPAEVPAALVSALVCSVAASGLVMGAGVLNWVKRVACDEDPA